MAVHEYSSEHMVRNYLESMQNLSLPLQGVDERELMLILSSRSLEAICR